MLFRSRKHALFAERVIRTFKEKLLKRMHAMKLNRWEDLIDVVVTQYNAEVHAATGMTPEKADLIENHDEAWESMAKRAKHNMKYETIKVGRSDCLRKRRATERAIEWGRTLGRDTYSKWRRWKRASTAHNTP